MSEVYTVYYWENSDAHRVGDTQVSTTLTKVKWGYKFLDPQNAFQVAANILKRSEVASVIVEKA